MPISNSPLPGTLQMGSPTTEPAATPAASRQVGVLALQGDFREHREILDSMGHQVREVRKPAQLDGLDALIIPGGESTAIARLILSNGLQQPLRDFCASGRPVWGTCAGAILLAKHVDSLDRPGIEVMDITVQRNAFGRQVDSFEADLDIKGLDGGPFHALFIRAPIFVEVNRPAGVLASLPGGTVVAAREANLLATSFHPELTGDTRLHEYFLSIGSGAHAPETRLALPDGLPAHLAPFLDQLGRFRQWPVKGPMQREAVAWLARQFEPGRTYSESEVNALLDHIHTFSDAALLRRLLFDWGYLERAGDGSRYWLATTAAEAAR